MKLTPALVILSSTLLVLFAVLPNNPSYAGCTCQESCIPQEVPCQDDGDCAGGYFCRTCGGTCDLTGSPGVELCEGRTDYCYYGTCNCKIDGGSGCRCSWGDLGPCVADNGVCGDGWRTYPCNCTPSGCGSCPDPQKEPVRCNIPCSTSVTGKVEDITDLSCGDDGKDFASGGATLDTTNPQASFDTTLSSGNFEFRDVTVYTGIAGNTSGQFCATNLPEPPGSTYAYQIRCFTSGGESTRITSCQEAVEPDLYTNHSGIRLGYKLVPIKGWFQTLLGDTYSGGGATVQALPTNTGDYQTGEPYMIDSTSPKNGSSGAAASKFGINVVNTKNSVRISASKGTIKKNYNISNYRGSLLSDPTKPISWPTSLTSFTPPQGAERLSDCAKILNGQSLSSKVYKVSKSCMNEALTNAATYQTGNQTAVIYVENASGEDLNILKPFYGSTAKHRLILLYKGNVVIQRDDVGMGVLDPKQTESGQLGVTIISGGDITVEGTDDSEADPDTTLMVDGSLLSMQKINLNRDRGDLNAYPAEVVRHMAKELVDVKDMELAGKITGLATSKIRWTIE